MSRNQSGRHFLLTKSMEPMPIRRIARLLGAYFVLSISGLYCLPVSVTHLIKPVFVFVAVLELLVSRPRVVLRMEHVLMIFACMYFTVVFLFSDGSWSSFAEFASLCLNFLVLLVATSVQYTEREVRFLLDSLLLGGVIFSCIFALSNPLIGSNSSRLHMKYVFSTVNANGVSYMIVLSIVVAIDKLLSSENNGIARFGLLFSLGIMLYSVFYTNTRGAFVGLLLSVSVMMYQHVKRNFARRHFVKIMTSVSLVALAFILIYFSLPEHISNRILNFSSYDSNSRDLLWRMGLQMARKNVWIGNGFGYWFSIAGSGYGSHNLYVDLLVSSGIVGATWVAVIVISTLIRSLSSTFILCLLAAPILNTLLESGMSYHFWNPLTLAMIMVFSSTVSVDTVEEKNQEKNEYSTKTVWVRD